MSRIYLPEAAAASFRLGAVVQALTRAGIDVDVITARAPVTRGPSARPVGGKGDRRRVRSGERATVGASGRGDGATVGASGRGDGEVRVSRWPVLRDRSGYVRGYLPYLSFDLPAALRLLAARRPDVVLVEPPPTTGAVARVVCAVRRVPYVYYAADVWSDATASTGAPRAVVGALRAVERFALRGARSVVAVSTGVAERVGYLRGTEAGVQVVPNGVDTGVFRPDGPGPADAPTTPFLLYAGTASEWQGAEVFAEAMHAVAARVRGARLVFLGQGSSWPRLRTIAASLPEGTIELRPVVPASEAAAWHRSATAALVSVRPGLGYDFAYPTKVLAAVACGTPVVYVGPGAAAADIEAHRLGEAVAYDVGEVTDAMVRALRAEPAGPDRARRARWVRDHRSLSATGQAVATVLLAGRT